MLNVPTFERKFELEAARRIVGELADLIRPACDRLEVGGSIRRGAPYVKDAELIAIPNVHNSPHNLHAVLDSLVERGIIQKARYGEKQTTRWGMKYRGLLFQGIKVEIFMADETNWGFVKWLRTGPGQANQYIMSTLIYQRVPLRFIDGDGWYSPGNLWHKPKDKWLAADQVQLAIPDEETLFALLGMPYLPPTERSEQRYKALMGNNRAHRWPDFSQFVLKPPTPTHFAFWDDTPRLIEAEEVRAYAGNDSISPFHVTDADAWAAQVYAESLARTESRLRACRLMAGTYPSYARWVSVLEGELAVLKGLLR